MAKLRDFLLYSNAHIVSVVLSLFLSTSTLLQVTFSFPLFTLSAAGAFIVYQLDRVWLRGPEDYVNQPTRVQWYNTHQTYVILSTIVAFVVAGCSLRWVDAEVIVAGLTIGVAGVIYITPYGGQFYRFKSNWILKPLFITVCWTLGTVLLPALQSQEPLGSAIVWAILYRAPLIFTNVVLADLADQKGDARFNVSTLANILSAEKSKQLAIASCLASVGLGVWGAYQGYLYMPYFMDIWASIFMLGIAVFAMFDSTPYSHTIYGYAVDWVLLWPICGWMLIR